MECAVQLVQGSITNLADVEKAVNEAGKSIKGVLQTSMILQDRNSAQMTLADWHAALDPKAQGTWNLHNATANLSLDFCMMFSSLSSTIQRPSQAKYVAGDIFLDAGFQHHINIRLPATVVGIGTIKMIEAIGRNKEPMQRVGATGFASLNEQELLDTLAAALTRTSGSKHKFSSGQRQFDRQNNFVLGPASTIPLNTTPDRVVEKRDRRIAIYHNAASDESDTAASGATLRSYIASAKADTSILQTAKSGQYLATEIGKKLFSMPLKSEGRLNISSSLADLGMDSLVAVELRT